MGAGLGAGAATGGGVGVFSITGGNGGEIWTGFVAWFDKVLETGGFPIATS